MLIGGHLLGPGGGESKWPCQDKWVSANGLDRTIVLLWMALTGQLCSYECPWQYKRVAANGLDRQTCCYEWPWQEKCIVMNGLDGTNVLLRMALTGQASWCEWLWQGSCVVVNGLDRTSLLSWMALTGQMGFYEWPWQVKRVAASGFGGTIILLWMTLTGQVNSCYNTCCKSQLCHTLIMEPPGFCGWKLKLVSSRDVTQSRITSGITFYSCLSALCSWFNWTHIPNFSPSSKIFVWNQ
jgi:hypothetical protein